MNIVPIQSNASRDQIISHINHNLQEMAKAITALEKKNTSSSQS